MHLIRVALVTTPDHVGQIRARKKAEALECGIDDAFISVLVERFYDAVREDDMLGPIFAERISDWPTHLSRMKAFWGSIMLDPGHFSGNPMQKHIAIGGLDGVHFERWWSLWDQTLAQMDPGSAASRRFQEAARRIGESLLTGIRIERGGLAAISARAAL